MKNKKKKLAMFFLVLFLSIGFFGFETISFAIESTVIINEIQVSGGTGKTTQEFVELYNTTDAAISLAGFKLKKKTKDSSLETYLASSASFNGKSIFGKGYFLLSTAEYKDYFDADMAYSGVDYSITGNNAIFLYDNSGKLIDKLGYGMASDYETLPARNPVDGKSIEGSVAKLHFLKN